MLTKNKNLNNRKTVIFLYYLLSFITIFSLSWYLFYLQVTRQIDSDLTLHLDFINQIISGKLRLPHEGFEYSVYVFAKLFKNTYANASIFLLAFVVIAIVYSKLFLLKRLTNISTSFALFFSILLMLVSAICLPMFNHNLYLGQGSPNVWHNPTLLCIKPFVFLSVYLVIIAINSNKKQIWFVLSMLLLTSFFYKPSFGIVFIPALGVYILCNHRNYKVYLYYLLMVLPSILFAFTFQIRNWILQPELNNSIIVSPFGVLHLYTSNVFISFLLATAFPLFFMAVQPRRVLRSPYLMLSWIMLIIGYLQFALLAETKCFYCANFSWGFLIALDVVFVSTFIEFIKYAKETEFKLKQTQKKIYVMLIFLFLTHLISGIGYLGRYIIIGSYM